MPRPPLSRRASSLLVLCLIAFVGADFVYQFAIAAVTKVYEVPSQLWLTAMVISVVVAWWFALVADRGADGPWLIIAFAVVIAGAVLSLAPAGEPTEILITLAYSIGAGITLFSLMTFSPRVVHPGPRAIFFSALGVSYVTVRLAVMASVGEWAPLITQGDGTLSVTTMVTVLIMTVVLFGLSWVVVTYNQERTLRECIMSVFSDTANAEPPCDGSLAHVASEMDAVDRRVIALMADGHSQAEICDEMGVSVEELRKRMIDIRSACREKTSKSRAHVVGNLTLRYNLTTREAEIVEDLWDAKTNAEIAAERFITERTVKFHVGNVMAKLGVASRHEVRELAERVNAEVTA